MKKKITKRLIDSLDPPKKAGAQLRVYDTGLTGFGVVVHPSGRKNFFLEFGPAERRQRVTLGAYGALTPDKAREQAKRVLARVLDGHDPVEKRRADRHALTFGKWADRYLEDVRRRKKHPRHDVLYLGRARRRFGSKRLDRIATSDVEAFFQQQAKSSSKVVANRALASVRACLAAAWRDGLIGENPALRVKPYPEPAPRRGNFSDDELRRIVEAIETLPDPHVRAGFKLLLVTGARTSEVLAARWEDVDLVHGRWLIPSPKAGRPQAVPLSEPIRACLADLPRLGPFVLPGRDPAKPRTDLKRPWAKLREVATVKGTLHDFRRTIGLRVARSAGVHMASKFLRHSDIRVTERHYLPLTVDDLAPMAEEMGEVLLFPGKRKAEPWDGEK